MSFNRLPLAAAALRLALISKKRPTNKKKVNMEIDSKNTSPCSVMVATKLAI
ncbi:Uncharacterised protein [Vibrio cholerae]|nr:Uncharacterised protein [Vibrio cholerae]